MELLATYSVTRIDTNSYNLVFSFPDNCNFNVSHKDGVYSITITLKKGQTQPSQNYVTENIICTQYNGCIDIQFIQQLVPQGNLEAEMANKPRMKISIND